MRNSGLSVETLVQYTKLYQEGNDTIDERKNLLIEERQKLIEKYEEIGNTVEKLTRKIDDYDKGKFETQDVPLKKCD
jgi:vacuolar-type H+-ATPase subunit D/Vma8